MPIDDESDLIADEDGRFYGGGITKQQEDILDYVSQHELSTEPSLPPEIIDILWVKKLTRILHRHVLINTELRVKHASDPGRFITSEMELDADIKQLSALSGNSELYEPFVSHGGLKILVGLLCHENPDIAISCLEIIDEITDSDSAVDSKHWDILVNALLDLDILTLLVSNLRRLDEGDDSDRNGIYHGLSIIENITSNPSLCDILGKHEELIPWILDRIYKTEEQLSQNKQYSVELLAIMAQQSDYTSIRLVRLGAIDILLQLVAPYRALGPMKIIGESEFIHNLFGLLTTMVDTSNGKAQFVQSEGVELCLIMLKSGMTKLPALRLLDYAAAGSVAGSVCHRIVQCGGLRPVFTVFMKSTDGRTLSHVLTLIISLLRALPPTSAERIRVLAKFVERDYEKIYKLFRLRNCYMARCSNIEGYVNHESSAISKNEIHTSVITAEARSGDTSLLVLRMLNVIISWMAVEDEGACVTIKKSLSQQEENLDTIKRSLILHAKDLIGDTPETNEMKTTLNILVDHLSIF